MKPTFQFYFTDRPQRATVCGRMWLAKALRAYRKHPDSYRLSRTSLHTYSIKCGLAAAVIRAA
jgi:hypothetical protein